MNIGEPKTRARDRAGRRAGTETVPIEEPTEIPVPEEAPAST